MRVASPSANAPPRRSRLRYVALALATIGVGLIVHLGGGMLGPAARDVLGDALWASMVFWWVGALAPAAPVAARATASVVACFAVEFSQLYHAPLLDAIRGTVAGHLVFGSGFDPRDLAAYAAGILTVALAEAVANAQ